MSREQREQELISSGLVDSIKSLFRYVPNNIQNKYFILIADYIDSMSQLDNEGGLYVNPMEIAKHLSNIVSSITDKPLNGIYGVTDKNGITMNSRNNYETNKLYFFHELTHAIQTRMVNNREHCSFYNGDTGMFLTEGATQFTAEILYNVSNGGNIHYSEQRNSVRGQSHHTTYSPLHQYQLNGNILMLLSSSLGIPLNQLLSLGYRSDGRKQLKDFYEVFPGQEGKFEEFMFDLEKIYSIDKLILYGKMNELSGQPRTINMTGGRQFQGNLQIQNNLINKIERDLAANFIANNDNDFIMANYQKIAMYLTTPELKQNFMNAVQQVSMMGNQLQ